MHVTEMVGNICLLLLRLHLEGRESSFSNGELVNTLQDWRNNVPHPGKGSLDSNVKPEVWRKKCREVDPAEVTDDMASLDLWQLLDKTERELELSPTHRDVVLLLGNTGTGKTTLTQLLVGNSSALEVVRLKSKNNWAKGAIVIMDPAHKIGLTSTSRTVIPELIVDKESGLAVYDCPGFSDNRGVNRDIAINFLLNKVTSYINKVKLVFTVIYPAVDGTMDKSNFNMLAASAAKFLKNMPQLKAGIGLIVTRAPKFYQDSIEPRPITDVIGTARNFIAGYLEGLETVLKQETLSEGAKALIRGKIQFASILLQDGRISASRDATECGPLMKNKGLAENRAQLLEFVTKHISYVPTQPDYFGYALESGSYLEINNKYVAETQDNITSSVSKLVENVKIAQQSKMRTLDDFVLIRNLLSEDFKAFSAVESNLQKNQGSEEITPEELGAELISAFKKYNPKMEFKEDMSKYGGYLKFFGTIGKATVPKNLVNGCLRPFTTWVKEDIEKRLGWYNYLVHVEKLLGSYDFQNNRKGYPIHQDDVITPEFVARIEPLLSPDVRVQGIYNSSLLTPEEKKILGPILANALLPPLSIICENDTLWVTGVYLRSSEFTDENGRYVNNCSATTANVLAAKTFFLDRPIVPVPSIIPNKLSILAPVFEAVKQGTYIEIEGHPGLTPDPWRAPDQSEKKAKGFPGEKGSRGFKGGLFFGVSLKVGYPDRFKIMANGGRGGQGQGGGTGGEGAKGRTISQTEWPSCGAIQYDYRYFQQYFNSVGPTKDGIGLWVMKYGEDGTIGGPGGDGGRRGDGGRPGKIEFLQLDEKASLVTETGVGQTGSLGRGGQGGRGGIKGDGYETMYAPLASHCYGEPLGIGAGDGWRASQGPAGEAGKSNNPGMLVVPDIPTSINAGYVLKMYKAFLKAQEIPFMKSHFLRILENSDKLPEWIR